jgi:flagellar biosynthesis protein
MTTSSEPTPLAVALSYDGKGAPRVVAKGSGEVADKILATAREHGVPLQPDADLVRLLAQIDLGEEIPRALYVGAQKGRTRASRAAGRRSGSVSRAGARARAVHENSEVGLGPGQAAVGDELRGRRAGGGEPGGQLVSAARRGLRLCRHRLLRPVDPFTERNQVFP